jgi:DoxX-like family
MDGTGVTNEQASGFETSSHDSCYRLVYRRRRRGEVGRYSIRSQQLSQTGLPTWFGYFIGTCEVLGSIGLFLRPLSALAALGLLVIMIGATYYHAIYTPIVQAAPAFVLALLCIYIFFKRRGQLFKFNMA